MKEKIQNQNGIIQIPLLIGIIVASIIAGVIIVYRIAPNLELTTITTQPITTTTTLASATDWSCGDSITFNYKGDVVTYGTVESQGRCWLDRNLGASQVATAYNDPLAYGDLFQWGREDDGHQTRTSRTTTILSNTDVPGHSNFIKVSSYPYDWRKPQNDNLWEGVLGINNPCPLGWRLPIDTEWEVELQSWPTKQYSGYPDLHGETNMYYAFDSPLKLTAAGMRAGYDAMLHSVGGYGGYWSSTLSGIDASFLFEHRSDAGVVRSGGRRADAMLGRTSGFSVRCIKD